MPFCLFIIETRLINNNNTDAPKPVWNLVYTASQAYNLPNLNATSWYNAATSMFTNETLFKVLGFISLHIQDSIPYRFL